MISASIPVANMADANATLEAQGYGPDNFSIPVYTGPTPTHATLHAWGTTDFEDAIKALPDVQWSSIEGEPADRVDAAIPANAAWGSEAPPLEGQVTPGLYQYEDGLSWVIQPYDTAIYPDPAAIPALVRQAKVPGQVTEWQQPLDQFDAYRLVNDFTGQPDRVTHNGQEWYVTQADGAGNNVWEPGVFGWTVAG
jgi:hypothetical protein